MSKQKEKGKMFYDVAVKRANGGWQSNKNRKKDIWANIKNGYVYISYDSGRSYWIFYNYPKDMKFPKITANDKTKIIRINRNAIKFNKEKDYEFAKECLLPWSR